MMRAMGLVLVGVVVGVAGGWGLGRLPRSAAGAFGLHEFFAALHREASAFGPGKYCLTDSGLFGPDVDCPTKIPYVEFRVEPPK